jgi:type II secretory pathway pseudopilin PulG
MLPSRKGHEGRRAEAIIVLFLALFFCLVALLGNVLSSTPGVSQAKSSQQLLLLAAQRQEQYFSAHGKYSDKLSALHIPSESGTSHCKYVPSCIRWEIRLQAAYPTSYVLQLRLYTSQGLVFYSLYSADNAVRRTCTSVPRYMDVEPLGCSQRGYW